MPEDKLLPLGDGSKYEIFLAKITEVQEDDIIHRKDCKFCNHPARIEGEKAWEKSHGSYAAVERFFQEYSREHPDAPVMKTQNVIRHIDRHYIQQLKRLRIREYAEHVKEAYNARITQLELLGTLQTMAFMELLDVASDETEDKTKKRDSFVKIMKTMLDIGKFESELTGDLKSNTVIADQIFNVFTDYVQADDDINFKRKFLSMLDMCQDKVKLGE